MLKFHLNFTKKTKNIVAVTGTNGKTSVSDFFYQILKLSKKPVGMIGTLGFKKNNNFRKRELTTSDTIGLHKDLNEMKKTKNRKCYFRSLKPWS